ncbi:AmpE protein [Escherichia coli]|uniref:AmpE protein n=1 Tax=Escherichia coli TaxID=562 RepID=A0A376TM83_ECOLX|nr:AmpE protein [Escherichia coli]
MTLFTTLLVLIFERLFKLGEHWQLDHRLEAFFRRVKHFSLGRTLGMTIIAMGVTFLLLRALQGVLFQRSHATGVAADWFAVYWRR